MSVALSSQLDEAVGAGGHMVFGIDGEPRPVERLSSAGADLYGAGASAEAVAVLMTNDQATLEILLGAVMTGATLVSLPLPGRGADLAAYTEFVLRACKGHDVEELVVRDDLVPLFAGKGIAVRSHADRATSPLAAPSSHGFRLVQFSSGSTQSPKPIVLGDEQLGANVAAIIERLRPQRGDVAVSWLPLSHDMGLIGMVLTCLVGMSPRHAGPSRIVLLDPTDFLRNPGIWAGCLDKWRGTITAGPDFGYRMMATRRTRLSLDLTRLRVAIVGGEIVRAETLTRVVESHADTGLPADALCPAYGLAEIGLAATITAPDESWCRLALDGRDLAEGELSAPRPGEASIGLVASGPALDGYEVRCGSTDSVVGPIVVRGPSVGIDGRTGRSFADADGWCPTGDAGFLRDDLLFVCGRTDDHLVAHGRNVYAPALERAIADLSGVRAGRVTAVGLPTGEWVVVVESSDESPAPAERRRLEADVRRAAVQVASAQPDRVLIAARNSLPFTPSGKVQRHEVRTRLARDGAAAFAALPID